MRFDWLQFSPRERQVLVRHFLFKASMAAPVTPENVCAAMQETHQMTCSTNKHGQAVIRFMTVRRGVPSGASTAETFAEGVYKAALRAKGVKVADGAMPKPARDRRRSVMAVA